LVAEYREKVAGYRRQKEKRQAHAAWLAERHRNLWEWTMPIDDYVAHLSTNTEWFEERTLGFYREVLEGWIEKRTLKGD
jgi:hypothetical protein